MSQNSYMQQFRNWGAYGLAVIPSATATLYTTFIATENNTPANYQIISGMDNHKSDNYWCGHVATYAQNIIGQCGVGNFTADFMPGTSIKQWEVNDCRFELVRDASTAVLSTVEKCLIDSLDAIEKQIHPASIITPIVMVSALALTGMIGYCAWTCLDPKRSNANTAGSRCWPSFSLFAKKDETYPLAQQPQPTYDSYGPSV